MYDLDDYSEINPELSREEKEFIVVAVATQIDRLSLKRLALISKQPTRQDKIKYIENELYRRAMEETVTTDELVKIHEELAWAEVEQTRTEIKDENSINSLFNRVVYLAVSVFALATVSSYLGTRICGDNRSYFCNSMHNIPNFIDAMFQEPKSKILPVDINK